MDLASVFRTLWEEVCFAPEAGISGANLWRNVELRTGFTVDTQARLALLYRVSRIEGVTLDCGHKGWEDYLSSLESGGPASGAAPPNEDDLAAASEACKIKVAEHHTLEAAGLTDALKANSNPLTPHQMSALLCIARAGTVGMPLPDLQGPTKLALKQVHFVVTTLIGRGLIVKNASTYEYKDNKGQLKRRFVSWLRLKKISLPTVAASDSRPYLDAIADVKRLLQQVPGQSIVALDAAMALGWSFDLLLGVCSILNRMTPAMKAAQAWRLGLPGYLGGSGAQDDSKDEDDSNAGALLDGTAGGGVTSPRGQDGAGKEEAQGDGAEEEEGGEDMFGGAYSGSLRLLSASGDSTSALLANYLEALRTDATAPFLAVTRVAGAALADDPYAMPPDALWPYPSDGGDKQPTRIVFYLHRPPLAAAAAPAASAAAGPEGGGALLVTRDAVLAPAKVLELVGVTPAALFSPYSALMKNADWYASDVAAVLHWWKLPEAGGATVLQQHGLHGLSDDWETVPLALPAVPGDAAPGGIVGNAYSRLEAVHALGGRHHLAGALGAVPEGDASGASAADGLRFYRHRVLTNAGDASDRPALRGLLPSLAARDFNFALDLWSTPGAASAVPLAPREHTHDNAFTRVLVAFGASGPFPRTLAQTFGSRQRRLEVLWKVLRDAKLSLDLAVVPPTQEKSRMFSSAEVVRYHDPDARAVGPLPTPAHMRDVLAGGASALSSAIGGGAVGGATFEVAAALCIVESLTRQSGVAQLLAARVQPSAAVEGGSAAATVAAAPSPRRGRGAAPSSPSASAAASAEGAWKHPCDAVQLVAPPDDSSSAAAGAPKLLLAGSDRMRALQTVIVEASRGTDSKAAEDFLDGLPSAMTHGWHTEKKIDLPLTGRAEARGLEPPPLATAASVAVAPSGSWAYSLVAPAAPGAAETDDDDAAAQARTALAAELLGLSVEAVLGQPSRSAKITRRGKKSKDAKRKQKKDKKKRRKGRKEASSADSADESEGSASAPSDDSGASSGSESSVSDDAEALVQRVKRRRGRPRKNPLLTNAERETVKLEDPTKCKLNFFTLGKVGQALEAAYVSGELKRKSEMLPLPEMDPVPAEVREADEEREGSRRRYFWSDRAVLALLKNYAAVQAYLEESFEQRYKRALLKWETGVKAEKEWYEKNGKQLPRDKREPPPLDASGGEQEPRPRGKRSLFIDRPQPVLAVPVMKWEPIVEVMGGRVPHSFMTRLIKAINERGQSHELQKYAGWLKEEREKRGVQLFNLYSSIGCARSTVVGVGGGAGGEGADRAAGARSRRASRSAAGGADFEEDYDAGDHAHAFAPPEDLELASASFIKWPEPAAALLAAAKRVAGDGGLPTSVLPVPPPADASPIPDALPWLGMETVATAGGFCAAAGWATGFSAAAAAEPASAPAAAAAVTGAPTPAASAVARALAADAVGTTLGRLCFGATGAMNSSAPRATYASAFKLASASMWNEVLDVGSASFLGLLPEETTVRAGGVEAFAARVQAVIARLLRDQPAADPEAVSEELKEATKKGTPAESLSRCVSELLELQESFCAGDIIATPQARELQGINAALTSELEGIAAPLLSLKQGLIIGNLILHRAATDQRAEARTWLLPHVQSVLEQHPAWQQLVSQPGQGEDGGRAFTRRLLQSEGFTSSFRAAARRAIVRSIHDARLGVRSELLMLQYYQPFALEGLVKLRLPALATRLSGVAEAEPAGAAAPSLDASDRWLSAAAGIAAASGALSGGVKLEVRLAPLEEEVAALFAANAEDTVVKHERGIVNSRKRQLDKQKQALAALAVTLETSASVEGAQGMAAGPSDVAVGGAAGVDVSASAGLAGSKRPRSPAPHSDTDEAVPSSSSSVSAAAGGGAMPVAKRARLAAAGVPPAAMADTLEAEDEGVLLMQDSDDEDAVRLPAGTGDAAASDSADYEDEDGSEEEEQEDDEDDEDDNQEEEQGSDVEEAEEEEEEEDEDGGADKKAVSKVSSGITYLCSRHAALRKQLAVRSLGERGQGYEPKLFFPFLPGSRAAAKVERQLLGLQHGRTMGRLDASVIDFTPALQVSARLQQALTPPRHLLTPLESVRAAVHKLAAVVKRDALHQAVLAAGLDGASLFTLMPALVSVLTRSNLAAAGISDADALWLPRSPFALLAAVRLAAQRAFPYRPPSVEALMPPPPKDVGAASGAMVDDEEEELPASPGVSQQQAAADAAVYAVPSVVGSLWVAGIAALKTHTMPSSTGERLPLHAWASPFTRRVHPELLARLTLRLIQTVFDAVAPTEVDVIRLLRAFHPADVRLLLRWLVKVGVLRRTFVVAATAATSSPPPGAPRKSAAPEPSHPAPPLAKKAVDLFAPPRVAPAPFAALRGAHGAASLCTDGGASVALGSDVPPTGLPDTVSIADAVALWEALYAPTAFLQADTGNAAPTAVRCLSALASCDPDVVPIPGLVTIYTCAADAVVRAADLASAVLGVQRR